MSEGTLIKPDCIPQEAWDQSGPAARLYSDVGQKARGTRAATWNELRKFVASSIQWRAGAATRNHGKAEIHT
jgi:hypothetical protein